MRTTFAYIARVARQPLALLVCALMPLLASAQSAGLTRELEAEILHKLTEEAERLYAADEAMDAVVARIYGSLISAAHVEVARTRMRRVLLHAKYHRYLLQLVMPIAGPGTTQAQLRSAVMEGVAALQAKGMMRLPSERQEDFAHHMLEMIRVLPLEVCKGLFLGTVSTADANMLERAYIASLPLAKFDRIVTLYMDAAMAELDRYPNSRSLSREQAMLADQAHKQAMIRKLRSVLGEDAAARVFRDRQGAPARDACTMFTLTVEAMVDLPEPYRGWRIMEFVRESQ